MAGWFGGEQAKRQAGLVDVQGKNETQVKDATHGEDEEQR